MIRFRVAANYEVLKRLLLEAPNNAKYMSKTIQNELICFMLKKLLLADDNEIWQMKSEIVPTLDKFHLLFDLLIN